MSLSMNIDTLVHALVMQELDGKGRENEALCFNFDLRISYIVRKNKDRLEDFTASRGYRLLYHQRPLYTYITVFSAIMPRFAHHAEPINWRFEAHHDQCWKYDNRSFHEVLMDMANEINEKMMNAGYPEVAADDMEQYNNFANYGSRVFEWIPVEVSRDPNHNYKKLVKVL